MNRFKQQKISSINNKKQKTPSEMDSTQIIKRRLAELKKMSVELKESTQNTHQVDYNIVYGILEATKSSASKLTETKKSHIKNSAKTDSPLKKILAMNSAHVEPYRALFPENSNTESQSPNKINTLGSHTKMRGSAQKYSQSIGYQNNYYGNSQQNLQADQNQFIGTLGLQHNTQQYNESFSIVQQQQSQQQIIQLRQQNSQLQRTILNMRHQLHDLKEKLQTVSKEQQWKTGLPYFKLNQKIEAFYTRMKINENDYHKIDHVHYDAQLILDKLVIKKSTGVGHAKELDLAELREVHYIDSIAMFLHFGALSNEDKNSHNAKDSSEDFFENLFIKFKNEEQLHRWDLAFYINFKLVESLKKDKLFSTFTKSQQKSRKRSQESHHNDSNKKPKRLSDNMTEDDQDLMKKLVERRDMYLETKKMVSDRMFDKINDRVGLISSDKKKQKQLDFEDIDQFSQTHQFQIQDDVPAISKGKFNYITREQNENGDFSWQLERENTSKFHQLISTGKVNLNTLAGGQNVLIPTLNFRSNSQDEVSFSPEHNDLSISRKLEEEKTKQLNEIKRIQQTKAKKIKQIIKKFTQEGYDLTKYSKDGFNPHDKRFFLSENLQQLCWEEEGGKSRKQIEINSIKEVQAQKIGEGIRKHIKRPKKEEHCIISYFKDNKMKVIQLGANSTVMAQFADELTLLMDHLIDNQQKNE